MKRILFFFTIMLFTTVLLSKEQNTTGIINGSKVNIREKPTTNSKIIFQLNENNKIQIIEVINKDVIVSSYFGKWCKIQHQEKVGYVLNSFIDSELFENEKFHKFYAQFYNDIKTKKIPYDRITFPFKYILNTMDGDGNFIKEISYIEKEKIKTSDILAGDGHEIPAVFSIKKDSISVYINFHSGCATNWMFKIQDKKWVLAESIVSSF